MAGYSGEKGRPPAWGSGDAAPPRDHHDDSVEAVVRYLADMTAQLESMARAANLELLAYLLAMARAEADSLAPKLPDVADDPDP